MNPTQGTSAKHYDTEFASKFRLQLSLGTSLVNPMERDLPCWVGQMDLGGKKRTPILS